MNRGNPMEEKKEAETVDRVLGHICLFHLPLDGLECGGEGPESYWSFYYWKREQR